MKILLQFAADLRKLGVDTSALEEVSDNAFQFLPIANLLLLDAAPSAELDRLQDRWEELYKKVRDYGRRG